MTIQEYYQRYYLDLPREGERQLGFYDGGAVFFTLNFLGSDNKDLTYIHEQFHASVPGGHRAIAAALGIDIKSGDTNESLSLKIDSWIEKCLP